MRIVFAFLLFTPAAMLAAQPVTVGGSVITSELVQGWSNISLPDSGKLPAGLVLSLQYLNVKHEEDQDSERHQFGSIQLGKRLALWDEKLDITGSLGLATDGHGAGFAGSTLTELRPATGWGIESHLSYMKIGQYNLLVSEPAVEVFRTVKGPFHVFGGLDADHLFARTTVGLNPGIMVAISKWGLHVGGGPIFERHLGEPGGHDTEEIEHAGSEWKPGVKIFATFHFGGGKKHASH